MHAQYLGASKRYFIAASQRGPRLRCIIPETPSHRPATGYGLRRNCHLLLFREWNLGPQRRGSTEFWCTVHRLPVCNSPNSYSPIGECSCCCDDEWTRRDMRSVCDHSRHL